MEKSQLWPLRLDFIHHSHRRAFPFGSVRMQGGPHVVFCLRDRLAVSEVPVRYPLFGKAHNYGKAGGERGGERY
jgi:hypothetical protein